MSFKNIVSKVKKFILEAGFAKLSWLLIGLYFTFTGSDLFAGAAFGIFAYINYNVLIKVIQGAFDSIGGKEDQ